MSVVVDFEEKKNSPQFERVLTNMFESDTVEALLQLRSPKSYHLVATVSGIVFGALVAVPLTEANKGIVQVVAMAVEPGQRNHRIATGMLKALVDEARREFHSYVITPGPRALLESDWLAMKAPDNSFLEIDNRAQEALPIDGFWSKATRTFIRKPLLDVPDPNGLIQLPIRVKEDTRRVSPRMGPPTGHA